MATIAFADAAAARGATTFDVDALGRWVVQQHAELELAELVIEAVLDEPWRVVVRAVGTSRGLDGQPVQLRLTIEIEEDLLYYTDQYRFSLLASERLGAGAA